MERTSELYIPKIPETTAKEKKAFKRSYRKFFKKHPRPRLKGEK